MLRSRPTLEKKRIKFKKGIGIDVRMFIQFQLYGNYIYKVNKRPQDTGEANNYQSSIHRV